MADAGLSSLGITLWVAEATDGAKVTDGSKYTQLTRINAIGELTIEPEAIDASALEDYVTKNIAGRSTVSDTYTVTINLTDDTKKEWDAILGKKVCFMTKINGMTDDVFVIATVPTALPVSSFEQNSLLTIDINCTTNEFIGFDTAVTVTSSVDGD